MGKKIIKSLTSLDKVCLSFEDQSIDKIVVLGFVGILINLL